MTLATGTVSSVGITISLPDTEPILHDVLTVDATPDPRQDGAPLLDGNGNVIGVVVNAGNAAPGVVALSMTSAASLVVAATAAVRARRCPRWEPSPRRSTPRPRRRRERRWAR